MPPKPIPPELVALRQHNTLTLWLGWRLRELAAGRSGEDRDFAALIEVAGSQWSRIKSGTPIGPKLARRIESACGQPEGWLDQPQEGSAEPGSASTLPWPDSSVASPQALADALGLNVDEAAHRLLRMSGDAMRDAGILDGNLLLVDQSLAARHGDLVVVLLDGELSCRQLHRQDGVVKLLPAHPDFPEILVQEGQEGQQLPIWGVVTASVRQFRERDAGHAGRPAAGV